MASPPPPMRLATSPVQANGLPPHGGMPLSLPPEKRQKLSHGPSPLGTSPVGTPAYSPYSPQWSPHAIPQQQPPSVSFYPQNPLESFNQPQPVQSPAFDSQPQQQARQPANAGTMGPPERPQKPLDPNDITDMVALSGVDLRAEDEYLAQSYLRSTSFTTSFDTQRSSTPSQTGTSFTQWSQGNYGSQPAFEAGRPFNQPPATEQSLEDELRDRHKRQARKYAELRQAHLRDPFLAAQRVREQIHKRTYEEHVRFNQQGIRDEPIRPPGELRPQDVQARTMMGPDGTGVVAAKAEVSVRHTIEQDSPVIEVLALLSLACNDRVRTALEDAFAVSRARQYGSQGVVPPEWSSVAQGTGPAETTTAASQSITHTSWDRPPDSAVGPTATQPPKPLDPSSGRLPTPPTEPSPPPQQTIAYKSSLPTLLRDIAAADREDERKRLEKRKRRQSSLAPGGAPSETASTPAAPSTPAAVDPAAAAAGGAAAPAKMTKKALAAEKKSAVNDEVQRKQANATANMALGGGGKKYSWLSGGKGGGGGGGGSGSGGLMAGAGMGRGVGTTPKGGSAPGTPGPAGGAVTPKAPVQAEDPGLKSREVWRKLGQWREDGEGGQGVQVRDLVLVLERDGLERRTLAKCYNRLKSDEKER